MKEPQPYDLATRLRFALLGLLLTPIAMEQRLAADMKRWDKKLSQAMNKTLKKTCNTKRNRHRTRKKT
ncbi:MAG: hypothetical protein HGA67_02690 [Candidatus Yonathbacteria bacterium]|nr:hypothetical protein [Candidatus Yonathbacteria bacterium]